MTLSIDQPTHFREALRSQSLQLHFTPRHSHIPRTMLAWGAFSLFITACAPSLTTRYSSDALTVKTLSTFTSNVHIVESNGKRLMVDSGNVGDGATIAAALKEHNINPADINYLVLTHGHADHAGNAKYFHDHYGIKIIAGKGDQPLLTKGENDELCPTSFLARLLRSRFQNAKYDPVVADIWVDISLDLQELGMDGQIRVVSGHTPGSLVILIKDKAFVGDLIRGGIMLRTSPTLHFYMCEVKDNLGDIKALLKESRVTEWYTGHFGPLKTEEIREAFP